MDVNKKEISLSPIYFYKCDEFNLVTAGKTKDMLLRIVNILESNKNNFKTGEEAIDFCLKLMESEYRVKH